MTEYGNLQIKDFDYPLPPDRIAQFPLPRRDASKLLVYKNGLISEDSISHIGKHLPANSLLVFNNTRVIHARLIFRKPTGGLIEIFCLEPIFPTTEIQAAFQQCGSASWKCLVGNLKRWKSGPLTLENEHAGTRYNLKANLTWELGEGCFEIAFQWEPPETTFSEILEVMGRIPLPPYISRSAETSDNERYQTIYARNEGSVAAPTAGLHFTLPLMEQLTEQGIETAQVTLHVGVGTFRPVSADNVRDHVMHHEKISVSRDTIEQLVRAHNRPVFAIGTTSARTLESLYWMGVKLLNNGKGGSLEVNQWDPYNDKQEDNVPVNAALQSLLQYLDKMKINQLTGETRLMIVPGYRYRILSGLITNFHMPQSTLLLLVAAMIGSDWKKVYEYALQNDFRFLSYGDSSLFFYQQA